MLCYVVGFDEEDGTELELGQFSSKNAAREFIRSRAASPFECEIREQKPEQRAGSQPLREAR